MPLANIGPVTVSSVEIEILPAKRTRKWAVITNVSANPIRVGVSPIDATKGIRLAQGQTLVLGPRNEGYVCPTDKIVGIREGGSDGTATALEQT